ncbi:hypothetical protein SXCC_02972 [Gluconacetobacter sp. SXCC-1]|nr:hypothetical protein SXCC_02972 [Gluconacetobacter sp. SXCC-1]
MGGFRAALWKRGPRAVIVQKWRKSASSVGTMHPDAMVFLARGI